MAELACSHTVLKYDCSAEVELMCIHAVLSECSCSMRTHVTQQWFCPGQQRPVCRGRPGPALAYMGIAGGVA